MKDESWREENGRGGKIMDSLEIVQVITSKLFRTFHNFPCIAVCLTRSSGWRGRRGGREERGRRGSRRLGRAVQWGGSRCRREGVRRGGVEVCVYGCVCYVLEGVRSDE